MGIKLTVDLVECSPSDLAKAAKFMLEYAGFKDPSTAQVAHDAAADRADRASGAPAPSIPLVPPMGSLGEEVHHDGGPVQNLVHDMAMRAADEFPTPAEAYAAATAPIGSQMPGNVPPPPTVDPFAHAGDANPDVTVRNEVLPPPPPGIEVDSQGVPWDSRIHAGSRAKIADGTWRQRRNLDPAVLTTVMAELRATMGVERRAPTPPTPPVPAAVFAPVPPVPPVPAEVPPVPFAGSAVPPAPPTSSTPSAPVSAGAATGASPGSASPAPPPSGAPAPTFPQLMQRITAAFMQKTLSRQQIDEVMAKVGLNSLPMLASRPDLVGDVATALGIAL